AIAAAGHTLPLFLDYRMNAECLDSVPPGIRRARKTALEFIAFHIVPRSPVERTARTEKGNNRSSDRSRDMHGSGVNSEKKVCNLGQRGKLLYGSGPAEVNKSLVGADNGQNIPGL